MMKLSKGALLFLGVVLVVSAFYFVYAALTLPPTKENHGWAGEIGGACGGVAAYGLVLL